jgi:hypothetical protein
MTRFYFTTRGTGKTARISHNFASKRDKKKKLDTGITNRIDHYGTIERKNTNCT